MRFLHEEIELAHPANIDVTLSRPNANVLLLDAANYWRYSHAQPYEYRAGGWTTVITTRLRAPYAGHWHLVVDLGGAPGTIAASYAIVD